MKQMQVVLEDWDGDGAIRIPDEVLQELGADVGDNLCLIEKYVGTTRCLMLSKSPQIPDRINGLVSTWEGATESPSANFSGFASSLQLS